MPGHQPTVWEARRLWQDSRRAKRLEKWQTLAARRQAKDPTYLLRTKKG